MRIRWAVQGCIAMLMLISCNKTKDTGQEEIIARIGDRIILKNEWIKRAEYTVRPPYCKQGDNMIHKKIILNSLIAEKLMALEAGEHNALVRNPRFQAFIKGRREQAMRRILYQRTAYDRVKLKDDEINALFQAAGRKYDVQYFSVPDNESAIRIKDNLNLNPAQFAEYGRRITGQNELPSRKVSWSQDEDPVISKALFRTDVRKGGIIGPLQTETHRFLFLRISGWSDTKAFTDEDIGNRLGKIKESLMLEQASVLWEQHIRQIMKGKRLIFNEEIFYRLSEIFAEAYHFEDQENKESFQDQYWKRPPESMDSEQIWDAVEKDQAIQTASFFTLGTEVFTVTQFRDMVASHPLVFRKRRFGRHEFPEQFKLAVVDLVSDQALNQEAYKNGLDKHPSVKQTETMWRDAVVGMAQRNALLDSLGKRDAFIANYMDVLHSDLNPHIRELQKKYSDRIEINANLLKALQLTRIDMFAIQKWEPYPIVVPQFPVMTDEHLMDYGKDM